MKHQVLYFLNEQKGSPMDREELLLRLEYAYTVSKTDPKLGMEKALDYLSEHISDPSVAKMVNKILGRRKERASN